MRRLLPFLFFILFYSASSQEELLDSLTLATYQEYTGLAEAIQDGDKVVKLSLRKQKFKEFPMEILQLKNLQYLDLSKNSISQVPDSLIKLKNLQVLIMSKNNIEKLPANFGDNVNLRYVNFNQNELTTLPYSFGRLEKLEYADLWSNNFEEFPETLSGLKKLRWMDLRNIIIPTEKQNKVHALLPKAKIHFSPPCNCGG